MHTVVNRASALEVAAQLLSSKDVSEGVLRTELPPGTTSLVVNGIDFWQFPDHSGEVIHLHPPRDEPAYVQTKIIDTDTRTWRKGYPGAIRALFDRHPMFPPWVVPTVFRCSIVNGERRRGVPHMASVVFTCAASRDHCTTCLLVGLREFTDQHLQVLFVL
jgi:hypothetical protein